MRKTLLRIWTFIKRRKIISTLLFIILIGFILPQQMIIPVKGADEKSWNHNSFWYYPWGKSVVHKGIDIFAHEGTPVLASIYGIVVYNGYNEMGGNTLVILGPRWKLHYYAHLYTTYVGIGSFVSTGEMIAEVGQTGNAMGKSPHLHYSIATLFPYFWRADSTHQGWRKMWYLNPQEYILNK